MRRVLPKGAIAFDSEDESYSVDATGDFWYDVTAFEQLLRRSRSDPPGGEALLREAAAVYRGDFLPQAGALQPALQAVLPVKGEIFLTLIQHYFHT